MFDEPFIEASVNEPDSFNWSLHWLAELTAEITKSFIDSTSLTKLFFYMVIG